MKDDLHQENAEKEGSIVIIFFNRVEQKRGKASLPMLVMFHVKHRS